MTIGNETTTALRPPWVHLARTAWLFISIACVTLFLVSTLNVMREPLPSCTAPDASCTSGEISREDEQIAQQIGVPISLAAYSLTFSVLARLSLAAIGIVIFWRRSDD
jgi:hypothetical protein